MIHEQFASVMNARTRAELHDEILRFTQSLGFERFSATVVLDDGGRQPQFISVCNPPAAYTTLTHDRQRAKLCPVSQHCKHHGTPIVWDRSDYATTCESTGMSCGRGKQGLGIEGGLRSRCICLKAGMSLSA